MYGYCSNFTSCIRSNSRNAIRAAIINLLEQEHGCHLLPTLPYLILIASSSISGSTGVIERPTITDIPNKPVNKPPVYSPKIPQGNPQPGSNINPQRGGNLGALKAIIIFETFKRILDAGSFEKAVTYPNEINPLTGEPYISEEERILIRSLTPSQVWRLKNLINAETTPEKDRLKIEEVRQGKEEENRCFYLPLGYHKGNYEPASQYQTDVTGDISDHLVINPRGFFSFYDGKLNPAGTAFIEKGQTLGSYAEVKLEHRYFAQVAASGNTNSLTPYQLDRYKELARQVQFGNIVANSCRHEFFLAFDNDIATNEVRTIFGSQYPQMNIHTLEPLEF